jgi:hypothetical protein
MGGIIYFVPMLLMPLLKTTETNEPSTPVKPRPMAYITVGSLAFADMLDSSL